MMKTHMINYLMLITMLTIMMMMMMNNHPIFMIINLIIYTLMMCMIMSTWTFNFIYSIILFLMMISGLLIIFLYFSSLISNEQNNMYKNTLSWTNVLINLFLITYFSSQTFSYPPVYSQENQNIMNLNNHTFSNILKIYNYPFSSMTLMCMLFLLISLIMIIKICSVKTSPLRKIS